MHQAKKRMMPSAGSEAATGPNIVLSHSLMPISWLVRADPSIVAAPVMRIAAQRIPLETASLKLRSGSPFSRRIKRRMQPKEGGMAVV